MFFCFVFCLMGGFLAQWATAKLHRFTVICFFSSFDFCSSFYWFLVLFLLSAGFPSLLRHQTWALLRSVERALGSINRITGVARAGVYGVCLHRPGPGEGWVTLRWDFLLPALFLCCYLSPFSAPPSLSVLPGYRDLSASSSHALPVYLWVLTIWCFYLNVWGKRVFTAECLYEWCLCVCVDDKMGLQGFHCRKYKYSQK